MILPTRVPVLFMCILAITTATGAMLGAEQGYEADNATAATITYNGTHVQTGTEPAENLTLEFDNGTESPVDRRIDDTLPAFLTGPDEPGPVGQGIQQAVRSFARHTAHLAFTLAFGAADVMATITYQNPWLPQWLVSGGLQIAAFVPMGGLVVYELARLRRVFA